MNTTSSPTPSSAHSAPTPSEKLVLSPVTLGCWSLITDVYWGEQSESDSLAAIDASLEMGVTTFDTAPLYGDGASEELVGRALAPHRDKVILATKVYGSLSKDAVRRSCEESLRRLRTDFIDLYQLHYPDPATPIGETAEMLLQLREEGKIRSMGVCNFGVRDLSEALKVIPIATNQLPYSLLWRGLEFAVLPLCRKHGVEVMAYSSLMQGLLSGKFKKVEDVPAARARTRHFASAGRAGVRHGEEGHEVATFAAIDAIRSICGRENIPMGIASLAALLAQPGVSSVIAGARNPRQARENASVQKFELSPKIAAALLEATESLKTEIGPQMDPWATSSRIQ